MVDRFNVNPQDDGPCAVIDLSSDSEGCQIPAEKEESLTQKTGSDQNRTPQDQFCQN